MASWELTDVEGRLIRKLRELVTTYDNFSLTIYGQGSLKRRILDMAWTPRVRLSSSQPLHPAIDD